MARVNEDRNCWECHRRLSHRLTGAVATLAAINLNGFVKGWGMKGNRKLMMLGVMLSARRIDLLPELLPPET